MQTSKKYRHGRVHATAPGKVLLAGGYMVLYPNFKGISLSLSARFHTYLESIKESTDSSKRDSSDNQFRHKMTVYTPQFGDEKIHYEWKVCETLMTIEKKSHPTPGMQHGQQKKTPLIDNTIVAFLMYYFHFSVQNYKKDINFNTSPMAILSNTIGYDGVAITLMGDEQFYNIGATSDQKASSSQKKTGLGSSAALVVSLTLGLSAYHHLPLPRDHLFVLCYLSHSASQGKLGSGFDIATSIYGSILFQQPFGDKKVQTKVQSTLVTLQEVCNWTGSKPVSTWLQTCQSFFDHVTELATLPSLAFDKIERFRFEKVCESNEKVFLLMCDIENISGGSSTPQLVRLVQQWKQKNESQCQEMWSHIQLHINQVVDNDNALIKNHFVNIRMLMKKMGVCANVPVIPHVVDDILTTLEKNNSSVTATGVPGAGGFDAIYVLMRGKSMDAVKTSLHHTFAKYFSHQYRLTILNVNANHGVAICVEEQSPHTSALCKL
ncbi:hypothetical protein RFI_06399 [Reticulomyxa filosa]|uniref:phosphomevalonate kinase n=1 Tax=Reticulomyxa filosa TaxID=46433 RepID=X6NY17_RETFI|nr:hypothetical protein RFI_06399 [Reticulomyxa filosa]|eukprot:ETO30724.1 hypothetical protein RFI_06399 [Reticulomyxa filosa]